MPANDINRIYEQIQQASLAAKQQAEEVKRDFQANYDSHVDLTTFFLENVTRADLKTMALSYDPIAGVIKIQTVFDTPHGSNITATEVHATPDGYLTFCRDTLGLDPSKSFNDSVSKLINGIPTRIFAILKPYKNYPLIVISTTKQPPESIGSLDSVTEKKLQKVLQGTFLLCGKSGAGKTYLLNYLLRKYFPKDRRLCLIQEFEEILPPNKFTDMLTTPPRVPGQPYNDLEFLAEQSNLMRYDNIIVGEIKSSEAWPFVVNCASGTRGGATIHGTDCQGALQRLRTLCLLARQNISQDAVDRFIKDAIEYVVYVESGVVKEVSRVVTVNGGKFSLGEVDVSPNSLF